MGIEITGEVGVGGSVSVAWVEIGLTLSAQGKITGYVPKKITSPTKAVRWLMRSIYRDKIKRTGFGRFVSFLKSSYTLGTKKIQAFSEGVRKEYSNEFKTSLKEMTVTDRDNTVE